MIPIMIMLVTKEIPAKAINVGDGIHQATSQLSHRTR